MTKTQLIESTHSTGVYSKRDLSIVKGKGALLWDETGREYIDCVGGQGAANLGHTHPKLIKSISTQVSHLISCPEMFFNPQRAALSERLTSIAPGSMRRLFLCNSGAEAVEAAFKFARYTTGKKKFVAAMRGFHGRTMGALSATWNKRYRRPFVPLVPGFEHIPYNNLERLDAAVDAETSGVILEVVQGEGGVHLGSEDFLLGAQSICRERGALLILDEVQTGFGRTGRMFAAEHYGLRPDILCLAKSIAGGVPMGAVLISDRVGKLSPGLHGSTFGGNPLACAAALSAIDILETERLPQRAEELGRYLLSRLQDVDSPLIRDVRGLGLMVGVEIKQKVAPFIASLTENGILALPAGMTVIRFLPPLVITKDQIDRVISVFRWVLERGS